MSLGRVVKDPDDERIWALEWAAFLAARANATISSSSWIVPSGITKDADSTAGTTATVKISGGTVDLEYVVTNRVVLSNGEQVDKSFEVAVRNQ